jgi:HD-GYP domain-containing protein (c-di-GMP phosphodiesterase class II)
LGLSEEFIEIVRVAAQLHDVGKIGIEDRILKKPGALTPEEFEIMKTHTTKGANILRSVAHLKDMIPGIELHHESLDGRGYPHALKDEHIPLLPRIIAVADTFDALTTNRPYQKEHDSSAALEIIHSLAGKRLDPTAVAALDAICRRGEIRLSSPVVPIPGALPSSPPPPAAPAEIVAILETTRS